LIREDIVYKVIDILNHGAKTELVLNVLLFTDFTRWEQKLKRRFIDEVKEILQSGHEKNRILLCYNPIMSISLCCEFLDRVGATANIFKGECKKIIEGLLVLGTHIINYTEEDKIDKLFHDTDFKDRTLLKIVSSNGFRPLFQSYKVNILLKQIWEGKYRYDCDG
jgi:hypothetical protein